MKLEKVNGRLVVRYEGVYRNIETADEVVAGDKVEVIKMDDNRLKVKKAKKK
jgi:membrane protein implicated in regulation of membrane protease activity